MQKGHISLGSYSHTETSEGFHTHWWVLTNNNFSLQTPARGLWTSQPVLIFRWLWALSRMISSSNTAGCGDGALCTLPARCKSTEQTHCHKSFCAVFLSLEHSSILYCSVQKKRVWRQYPNTTPLICKGFFTLCKATLKWPKFIMTPFQECFTLPELASIKGGCSEAPEFFSIFALHFLFLPFLQCSTYY